MWLIVVHWLGATRHARPVVRGMTGNVTNLYWAPSWTWIPSWTTIGFWPESKESFQTSVLHKAHWVILCQSLPLSIVCLVWLLWEQNQTGRVMYTTLNSSDLSSSGTVLYMWQAVTCLISQGQSPGIFWIVWPKTIIHHYPQPFLFISAYLGREIIYSTV